VRLPDWDIEDVFDIPNSKKDSKVNGVDDNVIHITFGKDETKH